MTLESKVKNEQWKDRVKAAQIEGDGKERDTVCRVRARG